MAQLTYIRISQLSSQVGKAKASNNNTSNQVFDSVTLQPLAFFHSEVPATKEPHQFFANSPLSHAQRHTAEFKSTLADHQAQVHRQKLGFPDKGFIRMKTEGQDAILQ